jgi:hypothetical protein
MIFGSSWLLGARYPWSQWTLLGLATALLITGGWLHGSRVKAGRIGGKPWWGWRLSAAALVGFVLLVGIQSVNISSTPVIKDNDCQLLPKEHVAWLPSSVGGEFDGLVHGMIPTENASRYLLIYSAAALGAMGLAFGVQSASTLKRVTLILVVHGAISSLICIAHQVSGSTKVLWIEGDPLQFLGSPFFSYKNQNAAYQTLLCAWTMSWSLGQIAARPRLAWSLVLLGLGGLVSIRSRAGMLFGAVLMVVWLFQMRGRLREMFLARPARALMALAAGVALLGSVVWFSGGSKTLQRLGTAEASWSYLVHGDKYRRLIHEVAIEMVKARPWYGWGAAGYFYAYASHERLVPEMASNRPGYSYYLLIGHADGDWYEFLAEFGIIGTALFALVFLPHVLRWARLLFSRRSTELLPMVACLLLLYHGLIDQTFRNSGVLFLLLASVFLVTRSTQTAGSPGGRGSPDNSSEPIRYP